MDVFVIHKGASAPFSDKKVKLPISDKKGKNLSCVKRITISE